MAHVDLRYTQPAFAHVFNEHRLALIQGHLQGIGWRTSGLMLRNFI